MPGIQSIAMISVRTTIVTLKNVSGAPRSPCFIIFLLFILGIFLNQNDVEFDFWIGHALVLFIFLWIIN